MSDKVNPIITRELLYDMVPMYPVPLGYNNSIMRVPGGWVIANMQGSCFVPYNEEFKPLTKDAENEIREIKN